MNILVINSGSSSIKFSVFAQVADVKSGDLFCLLDGVLSGIGTSDASLEIRSTTEPQSVSGEPTVNARTAEDAIRIVFDAVSKAPISAPQAVAYRVVHPGPKLDKHQRITATVLQDLEEAAAFAPLHDPAVVRVIREGMSRFPDLPHYACFDTVFHQTMPEEAATLPLPKEIRDQGVRRYGFHGLSCESIVHSLAATGAAVPKRMVIAHLGSGCSVTAVLNGRSVDTSMGLTPTGGIVMGTRPGDLDPGVVLYLLRQQHGSDATGAVEAMLNHQSGMTALTGQPNDMKAIRKAAAQDDKQALLGIRIFTRSITKAVGAYSWLLGGLDAIVFTGGIGEHDADTRAEVLCDLENLGIVIDRSLNRKKIDGTRTISTLESKTQVLVIPAQEDLMIALHVDQLHRSGQ
jgi:acetate kinase